MLGVERLGRRTTVSRVRGFYTQDGRVPTRTTDMTRQRRRDTTGSSREKEKRKESQTRPNRSVYKCQSRPYAHRTYTPALISTYSPYCLHVTTNAHQSDTRFCACHAPKVRASAGSLSSSSFVRRDQRVRSHTHLPAALVRHDDRPMPPDLCEASSAPVLEAVRSARPIYLPLYGPVRPLSLFCRPMGSPRRDLSLDFTLDSIANT